MIFENCQNFYSEIFHAIKRIAFMRMHNFVNFWYFLLMPVFIELALALTFNYNKIK